MGEVVELPVVTTLDSDPDRILQAAIGKLTRCIVIGATKDGGLEYFKSSAADGGDVLWDLERAKLKLLQVPDEA